MPAPSAPSPTLHCPSLEATDALGARLGALLRGGDVLALSGALGVGKTTLVQGIARGLGLDSRVPVTSPTFTLVNEYPSPIPLRHADFYRIESEQRLFELGFDDLFDGRGIVVVEWAERWPDALPRDRLVISISLAGPTARDLHVEPIGDRPTEVLRALGGG